MTRKEYIKMYQGHYLTLGRHGAGTLEWKQKAQLLEELGFKPSLSVLDYGCGVGSMAKVCYKRNYIGVDIASEAIRLARLGEPGYTFEVFKIGQLVCPPCDFVMAFSVFTHTLPGDIQDSMRDIKTHLKLDGFGILDFIQGDKSHDGHVAIWPMEKFLDQLEQAGLLGVYIKDITWPNGYTHTYLRIQHG